MATYKITAPDGNSYNVTAPDTASQDQVLAYAKANYQKASGGKDWMKTMPSIIQRGAQGVTMPFRGYRGMAVGLENLATSPMHPGQALERAAQAVEPGFKPKGWMETIASALGESAPLAPLGGELAAGGKIARLVKVGTLGGGLSALMQTAEEGKPTLGRTGAATALSMIPEAALQGTKAAFPYIAAKFTKTIPEAYQGLTSSFKKDFPGTSPEIESASSSVLPALQSLKRILNQRLQGRKEYMGMMLSPKEAIEEAQATGGDPRTISRIAGEFKGIQKRSAPISTQKVPSSLVGPTGQPLMKTITQRGISSGEKLRRLDDMAQDINKITEGSYSSDVYATKKAIEQAALKTGRTSYQIYQKFKQQWGRLKGIEDNLGTNLSNPDNSGKTLENLVRRQLEGKLHEGDGAKLEAVRNLESLTGKPIIDPLRKQLVSSYTNTPLSDFVPRGMLGKILLMKYWPEGLASFFLGSPKAMGQAAQMLYNPSTGISRTARAIWPSIVGQMVNSDNANTSAQ